MISLEIRLPLGSRAVLDLSVVELLGAIKVAGTVVKAAESVGTPYKKALRQITEVNRAFERPLVTLRKGGASRGGASLTTEGDFALDSYREAIKLATQAALPEIHMIGGRLSRRIRWEGTRFVEVREVTESGS